MRLLSEPLFYIYLVYGVSFLVVGFLVAKGAAGSKSVPLIAAFDMLALFGLAHGITEITDWIRFIRKTGGAAEASALLWLSQVMLVLSFVLLLQFAVNLFTAQSTSTSVRLFRFVPGVAAIGFVVYVVASGFTSIRAIGLLGRYTFGFISAVLASVALVITAKTLSLLGDRGLVKSLYVAAAAFACYAVFGGLMVQPIAGLPIQLFRSACALTIAVSCFSLIRLSSTVAGSGDLVLENA